MAQDVTPDPTPTPSDPPTISSINPNSGVIGSEVSISGSNFGTSQGDSYLTFDDVRATTITSWSDTLIKVKVPPGINGLVQVAVITPAGTSNTVSFTATFTTTYTSYLAEGSTAGGFETWILVQNPGGSTATVTISYLTDSGEVAGPTIPLEPQTRQSVSVADTVPDTFDVSTVVTSDHPVFVERSMYWGDCIGGHSSIAVTNPETTWYLAEGSTAGGFETWILVQNPGDATANVSITYMTDAGQVAGPETPLAPKTRESVKVSDAVRNTFDVSTVVSSDQPVIAERSVYWNDNIGGHNSIGVTNPSTIWYLAEGSTAGGFETWILVQNPGDSMATVGITYMTETGAVGGPSIPLAPKTRESVKVSDTVRNTMSVSTMVSSDQPIIAERAVYWGNRTGGHNSIGVNSPATTWYLAEGSTAGGFETWILVQNPGDNPATVGITYMTNMGEVTGPGIPLAPHTRQSIRVADAVSDTFDVSTVVTSDQPIIAERAMYWNDRIGGHNSIGHAQ